MPRALNHGQHVAVCLCVLFRGEVFVMFHPEPTGHLCRLSYWAGGEGGFSSMRFLVTAGSLPTTNRLVYSVGTPANEPEAIHI